MIRNPDGAAGGGAEATPPLSGCGYARGTYPGFGVVPLLMKSRPACTCGSPSLSICRLFEHAPPVLQPASDPLFQTYRGTEA